MFSLPTNIIGIISKKLAQFFNIILKWGKYVPFSLKIMFVGYTTSSQGQDTEIEGYVGCKILIEINRNVTNQV